MNDSFKEKQASLFWWMSPQRDKHYQWWWGYQKVRMIKLPEEEKRKFIEKNTG